MNIQVVGMGCAKCKTLEQRTRAAVAELGLDATVTKVEDFIEMRKLNITLTPALVVDGQVVLKGRLPSAAELTALLAAATR
jgi:small redox-active disulfide protein 2